MKLINADNELKKSQLLNNLHGFTLKETKELAFNQTSFPADFNRLLNNYLDKSIAKVSFDITSCSTLMIMSALNILLERNITLKIFYSEANVYHPTLEEYSKPEEWTVDGKGVSKGILAVNESRLYSGIQNAELPFLLVAFPTFKPERIRSIRLELQPEKTFWVLGKPHATANAWRKDALREINQINSQERIFETSTFNYPETFMLLEQIYREIENHHQMVIAPHGSKLQCIAIALFSLLRQDVALWFSTPQSFNPSQYTSGTEKNWQINFGSTEELRTKIRLYGKLMLDINA